MKGWAIWSAVLLTCLSLGALPASAQPAHIPEVRGTTFAGASVRLPEDLQGKVGVAIVGFTQASRDEVTGWGKRLANDYYGSSTVRYFEMPVLESVPRLLRGLVLGRIKASVSERGKGTFLPILDHEAEWKIATGFNKPDDAYVLLLDGTGAILDRIEGPITDANYADLKRRIEQLRTR